MGETEIKAAFGLSSFDDFDTDIVTNVMNIIPNEVVHVGDPIGHGRDIRRFTRWKINTGYKELLDISEQVSALTKILYSRENRILYIIEKLKLDSDLAIYLKIENEEYPKIELDLEFIAFMHRTRMEIGFDIYDFS